MKKKSLLSIIVAAFVAISISSCGKYSGYKESKNGLFYKIITKNEKASKGVLGDWVLVNLVYATEKDSIFFDSKKKYGGAIPVEIQQPGYKGDFMEIFTLLGAGDSAALKISVDSFFITGAQQPQLPPFVKKGEMMNVYLKVDSLKLKADVEREKAAYMARVEKENQERRVKETADLNAFLDKNKIKVKPTETGLYYVETKKGTGVKAEAGKKVKVHYTGTLLDGTKFDSSLDRKEPIEFTLGKGEVIKGWDEGISLMRVGGKARLVIPSALAYGERGAGQTIPPFSPLHFDVELIDVK